MLLLVAGHHSHVSLRLPVSRLCSNERGAKPRVQAVPTLTVGEKKTFRSSPFNNALSTCLYSFLEFLSNEMSFHLVFFVLLSPKLSRQLLLGFDAQLSDAGGQTQA